MPTGQNWINFIYVNLGFLSQVLVMYYYTAVIEIKKNWPEYRCNPIYMPLSDDIASDFTYCVQNTQINLMGYLLQPLTYLISSITSIGSEFNENLNGIRSMFDVIRNFIASIVENVFGVFSNIVIEFQVITIGIKDLVGKIVAILVTFLYMMDGANKTMESAWNGPPGQLVQALCFHPNTQIQLQNSKICLMKELELGNLLYNDSKIYAIIKIDNRDKKEPLYKILNGINGSPIYVTGSHYIWDKISHSYIQVKNYINAIKQEEICSDELICLLTTNHRIAIGEHIFWDWDDDDLVNFKKNKQNK
jgi:hypothetical protein